MWTITFSKCVENHKGMEMIGTVYDARSTDIDKGFTDNELKDIASKFNNHKLYELKYEYNDTIETCKASVLVLHDAYEGYNNILTELKSLNNLVDKHFYSYGKVVNKRARYNLCFADFSQEPDYINKKGRVINFKDLPYISLLRTKIGEITGHYNLLAELNYYYDLNKCGIGFHGDSERKTVIGCRFGPENESDEDHNSDLHFQW